MKIPIFGAVLLAGCTTMAPPPFEPTGPCRIDEAMLMRFAGTKYRMDQRDALQHHANARIARVLRPDDAATMDFREDRLNIEVDDDGRISGLRCG